MRMRQRWVLVPVLVALGALLPGLAVGAAAVPALKTAPVQDESARPLPPADLKRLEETVRANSGVEQYKILIIDTARPADLTAFLDQVWAQWQLSPNSVLLVVAAQENNAIRFNLGTDVTQKWGVSVDFMLGAIRSQYSAAAREGRLADALGALVAEVHRQVVAGGGQAASPPPAPRPAAAPAPEPWRLPRIDWLQPAVPWYLGLTGAALVGVAFLSYIRRLRRWNAHLQARLDRVLTQQHVEESAGRNQR